MRTALIIGAGVLAVYFLMRTAAPRVPAPTAAGLAGQPTIWGNKPPASIATPRANPVSLSGAVALSNAGCSAIASSKGVPSGLASDGCKLFSLVTPLGLANAANKEVTKIPYIGKPIASAENAVGNTAKNVYHSLTSWL